jgi:hypothetical protein
VVGNSQLKDYAMNVLRKSSSSLLIPALLLALTLTACHKQSEPPQIAQPATQPAPAPAPAPAIPAGWTALTNSKGGFSIAWPSNLKGQQTNSTEGSWRLDQTTPGMQFFTLDLPGSSQPNTNFGDATLTIGASSDKASLAACMTQDDTDTNPPTPPKKVTLNGAQFTVFYSSSAGAGNLGETTSYRILHGGQCYAVEYTIFSSNLGFYDPSAHVHAFDEGKVTALLDSIVATFKFQ